MDTSNFDPVDPDKLRQSGSSDSTKSDELFDNGNPFHGFFEFTFRRFFDDGGGPAAPFRISLDDNDNQGPVYVWMSSPNDLLSLPHFVVHILLRKAFVRCDGLVTTGPKLWPKVDKKRGSSCDMSQFSVFSIVSRWLDPSTYGLEGLNIRVKPVICFSGCRIMLVLGLSDNFCILLFLLFTFEKELIKSSHTSIFLLLDTVGWSERRLEQLFASGDLKFDSKRWISIFDVRFTFILLEV